MFKRAKRQSTQKDNTTQPKMVVVIPATAIYHYTHSTVKKEDFKNKVVLITGSTQGIGRKTAELLAQRGAIVVINSRNENKVIETVKAFEARGFSVFGSAGDVSNFDYCQQLRVDVIARFGKIDLLINNAGIAIKGDINSSMPHLFLKEQLINVNGSIFPTKVFIEDLKKSQGKILFISSIAGIIGLPDHGIYSATKRAIVSYAESLRNELKEYNVFVGVNYPGFTENDSKKTITLADGTSVVLKNRVEVKKNTSQKTASKIIEQLSKQRFYGYSSFSGKAIHVLYRLFPMFTLNMIYYKRERFKSA